MSETRQPLPPVEVFADVCCPFTHVGLRGLIEERTRRGRDEPRLLVRAWPLELVNGAALDPDFVAEEVEALRQQVAPDLFQGFDAARFPASSLPAFALAAAAYAHDPARGEAVSLAIRTALFEDGRDVGDPIVLAEIGRQHGLAAPTDEDRQQAVADWHEGRSRGVIGSPHFFLAGGDLFCPTLHIVREDGQLHISVDEVSRLAFLSTALA
jgi:predicted DsbA family dithiol-disulfide isomerase